MAGHAVRLTRCNPSLLDFVTWSVLKGCRLFQRVHITPLGLVATETIPEFDFVAVVPVEATQSVLNVVKDASLPFKVSPENHGDVVPFWQDMSRGSFAFVAFLTQVLLSGHPRGVQSYLDVLPFDQAMPIAAVADQAQGTDGYKEWTAELVRHSQTTPAEYDIAFRHAYCLFRRHAIPFWTTSSTISAGHPYFQNSPFVKQCKNGDILGLTPILDLALHSPEPNAVIGFPDAEMLAWLAQERKAGVQEDKGYFVMQALRDIHEGEIVTVNKNAFFNFDDDTFRAWFGYPNAPQVVPAAQPSDAESPTPPIAPTKNIMD